MLRTFVRGPFCATELTRNSQGPGNRLATADYSNGSAKVAVVTQTLGPMPNLDAHAISYSTGGAYIRTITGTSIANSDPNYDDNLCMMSITGCHAMQRYGS